MVYLFTLPVALLGLLTFTTARPIPRATDFSGGTGQGTYYDTGLTSCGQTYTDSDLIVALSHLFYDSYPGATANPNNNPVCGKKLTAQYQGKSVTVTVADRCTGCAMYDLDFTPTAFQALADLSVGRISGVVWSFDDDSGSSGSTTSSDDSSSSSGSTDDGSESAGANSARSLIVTSGDFPEGASGSDSSSSPPGGSEKLDSSSVNSAGPIAEPSPASTITARSPSPTISDRDMPNHSSAATVSTNAGQQRRSVWARELAFTL
ncbi:RlpA-like double-psi beta-barrel-protein domain-containing protein-containing protein [Lentinula raphanica]|nr:RlpA-like double-psi beta-barrel-protein domain-containing protein-containing protein [Lentinula raphanica]